MAGGVSHARFTMTTEGDGVGDVVREEAAAAVGVELPAAAAAEGMPGVKEEEDGLASLRRR